MPSTVARRTPALVLVLLAVPLLAGSQCAFFFSSGTSSGERDKEEQVVVVANGNFGAAPVAGIGYSSGSVSGVTGSNGEFEYEMDQPIQFSIGDIPLGRAVSGKAVITPQDLVPEGAGAPTAAINMDRLLQSLDADRADDAITIPASVRAKAVRSNDSLASAIEYLDFADDAAFANAASQLVTVLTDDYPFTGVLVDAQSAREAAIKSM